jgi:hypothetical protein
LLRPIEVSRYFIGKDFPLDSIIILALPSEGMRLLSSATRQSKTMITAKTGKR